MTQPPRWPGCAAYEACLVNAAGRVVTSSDPTWVTGDLLRGLPLETWFAGTETDHAEWVFTPCGSLPLGVISRPD